MEPFVEQPVPEPPLLNRALRIPDPAAAQVALNNLFATAQSVEEVSASHLADIAERYRLGGPDTEWDLSMAGRSIFAQLLTHFVADGEMSDDEVGSLVYVKELFGFTNAEARAIHDDAAGAQFRIAVDERLGDRELSDADSTFFDQLRDQLLLSDERAREETIAAARAILEADEGEATEHMTLSPSDAATLAATARALGVEWPRDGVERQRADRLRRNWHLDQSPLEAIEADLPLEPDEVPHLNVPKVDMRGLSFAHPREVDLSHHPPDGLTAARWLVELFGDWLFGSPKEPDDGLEMIDRGQLGLTSERLLFVGRRVEERVPLAKIRDAKYANERITVYTHGRPWRVVFLGSDDLDAAFVLLRRLLREEAEDRGLSSRR